MLAYHNNPALKAAVLRRVTAHQKADRIIQGVYERHNVEGAFTGGCAVGCTLESLRRIEKLPEIQHGDHGLYERYLGIPRVLARLEDGIFEGLPTNEAAAWPARFTKAIPVGADLSMVWPRFALNLLTAESSAIVRAASSRPRVKVAVDGVAALFRRWVEGTKPSVTEWREARGIAAAADDAAYAAYAAAAAADAAAYADAAAAAYAAAAAADADAAARLTARLTARQKERQRQADVLIKLLESA